MGFSRTTSTMLGVMERGIYSVGNPTRGGEPFCSCDLHFLTTSK